MKRKFLFTHVLMTFKKWSNTSWGVFNSIGKQIRIGMLPLAYFLCSIFTLNAQTDTIPIDDIMIISSRIPTKYSEVARVIYTIDKEDIESMPVHSLQDLIEYVSGVDVRQRGTNGVQADISIRGGNFDQALILLNGFKMNDVQTGHHNMNLPVDIENIERIEILEGPGNRFFGINAYSGAINFITKSDQDHQIKVALNVGQYKNYGIHTGLNLNHKNWFNNLSFTRKKSEGYLTNDSINNTDYETLNLFYESELKTKLADISLQAGFTDKSFGANSFYTPAYPWQYENTKTIYAAYKVERQGKNSNIMYSFSWRRHQDRFELFREDRFQRNGDYFIFEDDTAGFGGGYYYKGHNYHKTNVLTGELKYDIRTKAGKTAIGTEYRQAFIQSNVLGLDKKTSIDVPFEDFGEYTKEADRLNVNIYAEHLYKYKKIMFAGGISSNYNNDYNWHFNGGTDISYNLFDRIKLYASLNTASRLPTFTDLYYEGPTNIGNPDLKPEHATTYETGIKYTNKNFTGNILVFRRDGRNTIDWVRLTDEDKWQPKNITELTTYGFEFFGSYKTYENKFIKKVSLAYSYLDINKLPSEYQSKYALDYLKHKAVFSLHHKLFGRFSANWKVRYEDRNDQYIPFDLIERAYLTAENYKPFAIVDLKVYWIIERLEVYVSANNLFDTEYIDFGNIHMPGRWIKGGVRIKLGI